MVRQPSDIAGLLFVFALLAGGVVVGMRQWLGYDRTWYERPDPSSLLLINVTGPSPLMLLFISVGIGLALLGMLLGSFLVLEVLAISTGMSLCILGLAVAVVRPRWALPRWMRDLDQARTMEARVRTTARSQRRYWTLYVGLLAVCVGIWLAAHAWRW